MNYLPILLALFLLGGKNTNILELLKRIDFASFMPILKILGIDSKYLDLLSSPELTNVLDGKLTIENLSPIIGLLSEKFRSSEKPNTDNKTEKEEYNDKGDHLNPIGDFVPEGVADSLNGYFT